MGFVIGIIAAIVIGAGLIMAGTGAATPAIAPTTVAEQEVGFPNPDSYIVDQSDVLSESAENALFQKLKAFDEKAQIAVVTLKTTGRMDEKQYAIKLAEKWKVGHAGKDNGVIFLIVTGDRKLRIEVGRGLEGSLNDSKAGRILDEHVVPELKNNNWEKGIINGVDAIIKEVK